MNTKNWLVLNLLLFGILVFGFPQNAAAQDQQDPPSRVGRLNYVEGSVSYQPSGSQDWVQGDMNRPLTTGDNLWADQGSRAEIHIGSTAFRMGNQTGISFLNLSDQAVQIQLAQGDLEVDLHRLLSDEAYEIDTPNLAFSLTRPGEYRIETDPNGTSTTIIVYSGEGSVSGGGQSFNVTPGQQAIFIGTNQLSEDVRRIGGRDSFYDWSHSREVREEHFVSARYVSPGVTGYEDLDQYGSWQSDPTYGEYWVPNNVSPDWASYHEGHWCWVAPWGWTWVDSDPWGFAPFHYGRWAMFGARWGWVPGPVVVQPVYAPALVGFVGGGGFGVSIAVGSVEGVGWFPLGPCDVYVPAYQVSPRYVQEVNISNTRVINRTTITNVYNNYTVNHVTNVNYTYATNTRAVTVVNRDAFVSGQPVRKAAVRVDPQAIQHPRVIPTAVLTPTRASVIGAAATPARAKPPAMVVNRPRPLVTKMRPAPQADPIGKPRPATNPSLSPAVLQRSGYSPQLQTIRATAAAKAPARRLAPAENKPAPGTTRPGVPEAKPPAARPNETPNRPMTPPREQPRPEAQPNRPFTPPNRPRANPRPKEAPARLATPPREQPRPNERQPNRPFTPPNRPATNPRVTPPPERQPNRPATEPRPEARPTTPPERRPSRPAEQPHPEARPHTAPPPERNAPPVERKPTPPPRQEKPKEKPHPQPQPQP